MWVIFLLAAMATGLGVLVLVYIGHRVIMKIENERRENKNENEVKENENQ
jgi:membrane protein YqaA with SNARE-associated domain